MLVSSFVGGVPSSHPHPSQVCLLFSFFLFCHCARQSRAEWKFSPSFGFSVSSETATRFEKGRTPEGKNMGDG